MPGEWNHVALVVSPGGAELYVNGVRAADAVPLPAQDFGKLLLTLGTYHYWSTRNFNGQIDEVAIYNRALDSAEIRRGMHHFRTPTESSLMGYYQFNESQGSVFYDKVRGADGSAENGASSKRSTIPVAAGVTELTTTTTSGWLPNVLTSSSLFVRRSNAENLNSSISLLRTAPDSLQHEGTSVGNAYWIYHNYSPSVSAPIESVRIDLNGILQPTDALSRTFAVLTRAGLPHQGDWSNKYTRAPGYYNEVDNLVTFSVQDFDSNIMQWTSMMSGDPVASVSESGSKVYVHPQPVRSLMIVGGLPSSTEYISIFDIQGIERLRVNTHHQPNLEILVDHLADGYYTLVAGSVVHPILLIK
jgi:hypothetical protein